MRADIPSTPRRTWWLRAAGAAALVLGLAACALQPAARLPDADAPTRAAIAPTGTLRVAVYAGSPTSLVKTAQGEPAGVAHDLGRLMAQGLGLPVQIVEFQRVQQVVEALRSGAADVTFSNASPARAQIVDFTAPLLSVELGYLVPTGSRLGAIEGVDAPGVRVGVSEGSSSQAALTRQFRAARVVPVASLSVAREMLRAGQLDAFATNKAVLHEMRDALPGAQILPGNWGLEHMAIALPKGRPAAQAWMQAAGEQLRRDGRLAAVAERAGLRGLAPVTR